MEKIQTLLKNNEIIINSQGLKCNDIIVCAYYKDNIIKDIDICKYSNEESISFVPDCIYDYVKVMTWENGNILNPVSYCTKIYNE